MREIFKKIYLIGYKILSGYFRFIKKVLVILLFLAILGLVSFFIVFPPWFFSINYKLGYNIFSLLIFFISFIILMGKRIAKGILPGRIINFTAFLFELVIINIFLSNSNTFIIIFGLLLSIEYILFLCLIKKRRDYLSIGMIYIIITLSLGSIIRACLIISKQNELLLFISIPIVIFYFFSTGYIIYDEKSWYKRKNKYLPD